MKRRTPPPPKTELNAIGIAPLAIARGAASSLVRNVRRAVDVVQTVRSSVKSVALVAEPVRIEMTRQPINPAAVVRVPVGVNELALKGGMHVRNDNNTVTLSMNFDAYLVDGHALRMTGKLLSQASCRFNTQVHVTLHETIESSVVPSSEAGPRLLVGPSPTR